ncbi:MAG TPA: RidA family protein [Spirochaeta sp.]|nr:RidA family protein [Spirochaeta sp.]
MDVYEVLKEKGITLPEPPPLGGVYVPVRQTGNLCYSSGAGPIVNGKAIYTGKLGADLSIEEGQEAAKICILNVLSVLQNKIGDLNKVKSVVKLLGFVASAPGFNSQPKVINGGSELLIEIFGEAGAHARSAIGTNELPDNISVEIEVIFEVE